MSVQQTLVPHTTQAYEDNGKYYLKTFLLDSSTARNGMGVQEEYIPRHINRFIDQPVILTQDFYHPHEFEHYNESGNVEKDLAEYRRLQTPYIIGKIVSVDSNLQQAGGTRYSALLEISDEKAISAFKQGKIPLYVSPSIYRVHNKDPIHSITDYEPLHIAVVSDPAYGFHKANIRAHCSGNKTECSRMLAQASNTCNEKLLGQLNNVFSGSVNSSYSDFKHKDNSIMTDNENAQTSVQQQTEQSKPEEQKQEQVKAATVEQKIQEQKAAIEAKTSINTPAPVQPVKEEVKEQPKAEEQTPCAKAKAEYEAKIAELENDIKSFKEFKANYEKTSAETKLQSKRSRIENVVPTTYASSEEERTKAIDSLMNVPDEQLDTILNSFVIPATKNVRQGGQQRKKVTDFVQDSNKNVAQASVPKVSSKDIENLDKILNFGIVPKKNNTGGIA